ncbi:MAG TPA: CoA-binding protein [Planctomycetota bacterium]|nr:CoA-binding protein [Planctomycetota bacterium]
MKRSPGHAVLSKLQDLMTLLDEVKTIAVVGLSEKPERDSHSVCAYLQRQGYRIVGVNPAATEILGEPCFPSLSAIPEELRREIDMVAVFRRPEDAIAVLDETASLGIRKAWLVPGASSAEAIEAAAGHGLTIVADRCLRTVHAAARRGIS